MAGGVGNGYGGPSYIWEGGDTHDTMNFKEMQIEVQRLTGRNDPDFVARIKRAINRSIRLWCTEYPWEELRTIRTITHHGGRYLTFPGDVQQVIWLLDQSHYEHVAGGDRLWDKNWPYTEGANVSGLAREWEPAEAAALITQISSTLSFISMAEPSSPLVVFISGRIYDPDVPSGSILQYHDSGEAVTIPDTMIYETSFTYRDVFSIAVSDFPPSKQGIQIKAADGTLVGLLTPFEMETRYYRIRFLRDVAAGTVFKYGAIIRPPSLVNDNQIPHAAINRDYLLWQATADILWQTKEDARAYAAEMKARRIANEHRAREMMWRDQNERIIPEDVS